MMRSLMNYNSSVIGRRCETGHVHCRLPAGRDCPGLGPPPTWIVSAGCGVGGTGRALGRCGLGLRRAWRQPVAILASPPTASARCWWIVAFVGARRHQRNGRARDAAGLPVDCCVRGGATCRHSSRPRSPPPVDCGVYQSLGYWRHRPRPAPPVVCC